MASIAAFADQSQEFQKVLVASATNSNKPRFWDRPQPVSIYYVKRFELEGYPQTIYVFVLPQLVAKSGAHLVDVQSSVKP